MQDEDIISGTLVNTNSLKAFHVQPKNTPPIQTANSIDGNFVLEGHPGGILTLSANGSEPGSGIVWAATYTPIRNDTTDAAALQRVRQGQLRAYAANDLRPLWTSSEPWDFAKFTPPTVANGKVYMATFSNKVVAYGLLPQERISPRIKFSVVEQLSNAQLRATVFASDPITGNPLTGAVTISGRKGRLLGGEVVGLGQPFRATGTTGVPITFSECYVEHTVCDPTAFPKCHKEIAPASCSVKVDVAGWASASGSVAPPAP